eukprot:Hpha_TRINITY_DN34176_c0_g1::TRINITY_DN34176_c0_g1_i1::g.75861::m.75861
MCTAVTFVLAVTVAAPTRVLFVGNSFTFVNDLPHQFKHVAESLGREVLIDNSTIGGCTLYSLQPEFNRRTKELLEEEWDYIVLQDYSSLPTIAKARAEYMSPAVKAFAKAKKRGEIVMYLTWGYQKGNTAACPETDPSGCFPKGSLASLTEPLCSSNTSWHDSVDTFACMGYSLARGYLNAYNYGADRVAPCGVAWQVVRGVSNIPDGCRAAVDSEYSVGVPTRLPYPTTGALAGLPLYRVLPTGDIDIHPNVAGQYVNALTFYATLFAASPVGAAAPLATEPDVPLTPSEIAGLQAAVEEVVLKHRDVWRVPAASARNATV